MNSINQLFFMVLISSVSSLLFLVWRLLRGFFMLIDARLIYKTLRWVCVMYVMPFGYAAALITYRGWFRGDIRLWKIIFVRSGKITQGVHIASIIWFVVVLVVILVYLHEDWRWNRKRRDNIEEIDPIAIGVFREVCAKLDIPEGKLKLCRNMLVNTPLIIGCRHPEVLLPENDYTVEDLEMIFFHELSHYKHKDLLLKRFVMIVMCIHGMNLIVLAILILLFRTVNRWSECMADLSALEASGSMDKAGIYFDKIVALIPHDKNARQDNLFISTLSNDGTLLAKRMDFMLKYIKEEHGGKSVAAVVTAAFVIMSATTAFASGKTVVNLHNMYYQYTEEKMKEPNRPALGKDVVADDGIVEHYCNIENLDMTNMQIVSLTEEDVSTYSEGVYYNVDWDAEANTRYVSRDYVVKAGGRINVSVTLLPVHKNCWLGIMNENGTIRYIEGSGALGHVFDITETSRYRVLVQNNYKDGTLIHVAGSFVNEN